MLRGNILAKVDEKGRLKVPSVHRSVIEPRYGRQFFVTSIRGESVHLYPMEVYSAIEEKLVQASYVDPLVNRLRNAFNYYGQSASMDAQGRILIHPLLRNKAEISGEVAVLGHQNFLVVWNHAKVEELVEKNPLADTDLKDLATFGF